MCVCISHIASLTHVAGLPEQKLTLMESHAFSLSTKSYPLNIQTLIEIHVGH